MRIFLELLMIAPMVFFYFYLLIEKSQCEWKNGVDSCTLHFYFQPEGTVEVGDKTWLI